MTTPTQKHQHSFTRSKPGATVETCACGKFRHTEHSGPAIVEQRTQHTPGPWLCAQTKYNIGYESSWKVWPEKDGEARICSVVDGRSAPANARLIAAAPDLLAACKELWNTTYAARIDHKGCECLRCSEALKAAEAAIAKAEKGAQ